MNTTSEEMSFVIEGLDRSDMRSSDAGDSVHIGFANIDEPEEHDAVQLDKWRPADEVWHVDLFQEAYTPREVAILAGTTLEVVMHAVWNGDLRAERAGHDVSGIPHHEVLTWLRQRPG